MFDYQKYGAFKATTEKTSSTRMNRLARAIGLRNRYMKFFDGASRTLPLLELGCGNGSLLLEFQAAGFQKLTGVEPSDSYQKSGAEHLIVRGYAEDVLPTLAQGSLGTVVAMDVFEHIPADKLRPLLSLIEGKLAPGGLLVFRVPNMASALGLYNFYGDLSHVTALNEISLRQLTFDTRFAKVETHPEPLAYPRSLTSLLAIALWGLHRLNHGLVMRAFGIQPKVLTPNIVCVARKAA